MRYLLFLMVLLFAVYGSSAQNTHTDTLEQCADSSDSFSVHRLNPMTVTGSRHGVALMENIASLEVVKTSSTLSQGLPSADQALNRVPGVDVIENQINIRGGAGWSYGAGSRVLILVDDIPMMTADASDVKWNFLPIENGYQIEVLKGAASGIYGASALNGVVNFRTSFARARPETKFQMYSGVYSQPRDRSWTWWTRKTQPYYIGGYLTHKQKFGKTDLVLGTAYYSENSYLEQTSEDRIRIDGNIRQFHKRISGLYYGLNFNYQYAQNNDFLFWEKKKGQTAEYLRPYGGDADSTNTINLLYATRYYIDPYITYLSPNGSRHKFKNRWFRNQNHFPTSDDRSSQGDLIYNEYNFQKNYTSAGKDLLLTLGAVSNLQVVKGDLFGNHQNHNMAIYAQSAWQWDRTRASISARLESNKLNGQDIEIKPVFRAGFNHRLGKATHLRASFGQGYRAPSIGERFSSVEFGVTRAMPNPNLKSETGWTAEIGAKQLWGSQDKLFYLDAALFWMQYQDMIEYNFGLHLPPDSTAQQIGIDRIAQYIGWKSLNVGDTRIQGLDISLHSQLSFADALEWQSSLGYTYLNPHYINADSAIMVNLSGETDVLKYRYRNTIKLNTDLIYQKWKIGLTLVYSDFMENVDEVMTNSKPDQNFFGKLFDENSGGFATSNREFREQHNHGQTVLDLRLSYHPSPPHAISLIARNLTNVSYMQRPGIISPLRSWMLQYSYTIR